jgi:glycine cleavage system transcriptional repressor
MKTYFILSAVGKDRPGIVADVSEVIYECGGNIEDSSMSLLRNYFSILILFSTEREEVNQRLSSGFKHLGQEKNLTIFYSPITFAEVHPKPKEQADRFKITTSGVDHAGSIWRPVASYLQRAEPLFLRWIWILTFPIHYQNRA